MKKIFPFICVALFLFSCTKNNTSSNNAGTLTNTYSNQSVGASSKDLLIDTTYTALNVEIQYMPGYQPDSQALINFINFLTTICNKPNGVNVKLELIPTQNKSVMTLNDVMLLEKQSRNYYTNGHNVWLYMLITDGYSDSTGSLGMAYRNTSICIFGKNISDSSGNLGQVDRSTAETALFNHELGHLLGLVNLGCPMQTNHLDTAHGNQCNNPECLMYYKAETADLFKTLIAHNPPKLDANCIKDLIANGGK
jgi:hypothetical protein